MLKRALTDGFREKAVTEAEQGGRRKGSLAEWAVLKWRLAGRTGVCQVFRDGERKSRKREGPVKPTAAAVSPKSQPWRSLGVSGVERGAAQRSELAHFAGL